MTSTVELADLGLDEGGHLLVKRALVRDPDVMVVGTHAALGIDLAAWCRAHGHAMAPATFGGRTGFAVTRGRHDRWRGAERAGGIAEVADVARAHWGLAARGALVEAGAPALELPLAPKERSGPTKRRACTRRPPRRSGIPPPRSRGMPRAIIRPRSRTRSSRS